jgi:outer membrane protein TolC
VPGYSLNPASGVSPWFPLVSLDIPIETAGKRGYRISHAQKLSEAARLNIASAAWQVRSNLRLSLLDFSAAQRRSDLLQQQLQGQQQIVTLLEQRLQAGAVARTELTLPRVALARLGVDAADAARQAAEARVRIADALGLSAKAIAEAKFDSKLPVSAEAGKELTSEEARQQALLGRSDILAALADYAATESLLRLELAKQYPDIHLNPGYQFDQGEHKWSLGLSAELPVLNRNQGPIAEADAKREEAAARFVALQAKIIAEIDRALAARAAAMEQVTRQSGLTQLAREQSASVEAMFQAGAADKLELSSAQLEARATDLAYLDAQIKAQQAVAQLEDAIQQPLEPWPALEHGRSARAK